MAPSKRFLQPINIANIGSDPVSASVGDIYYNSASSSIRFFNGTEWKNIGADGAGAIVSSTAPPSPSEGDIWFDNVDGNLYIYDGTYWQEAVGTVDGGVTSLIGTSGQINVSASTGAITVSLANSGVSASTYGSASQIPILVVDARGRITSASVASVEGLPSQTGNSGKYLTTDGTNASWATVQGGSGVSIQTDVTLSNSWWLGV